MESSEKLKSSEYFQQKKEEYLINNRNNLRHNDVTQRRVGWNRVILVFFF